LLEVAKGGTSFGQLGRCLGKSSGKTASELCSTRVLGVSVGFQVEGNLSQKEGPVTDLASAENC
jgi:hypothetical protein